MNTEEPKDGRANVTEKVQKLPPHAYVRNATLRRGREMQERLRMVGLKMTPDWTEIQKLAEAGRKAQRDGTARAAGIALLLQVQDCIGPLLLKERLAYFATFTKAARRKQALENIIGMIDRAVKVAVALGEIGEVPPKPTAPLVRSFLPGEIVKPVRSRQCTVPPE